jgi:hypothetical protein
MAHIFEIGNIAGQWSSLRWLFHFATASTVKLIRPFT